MSYNENIKLRAYSLFLQGHNFEQIAGMVRSEFGLSTLKGATIKAWSDETDLDGASWVDNRRKLKMALQNIVVDSTVSKLGQIKAKTETIMNSLFEKIVDEHAPRISSYEGSIYAFKTISDFFVKLDDRNKDELNPALVIQMLLDIFNDIPDVQKAIGNNWELIQDEIRQRIMLEDTTLAEIPSGIRLDQIGE